ncbi:hypothetical protein BVC80_1769g97 [Macleaya cordata]|uniref:Uncharacterized protein n=1 Tax=Macleaya cordata TaxID=56857 RepID=A0A200QTM7_MACCD|nr:hypothetical protein BVC80_1769g97 [Macleaya cordata]
MHLTTLGFKTPFSAVQVYHRFSPLSTGSRVSTRFYFLEKKKRFPSNKEQLKAQRICSTIGNGDASDVSNFDKSSADQEGSGESCGSLQAKSFTFNEFYVAPAPGRMGYVAAAQRFLKLMAMVWAGSQVTKLARVGGALALAPFVDRGLSWFTMQFKFQTQGKAFMAIVGGCFGLAVLLFFVVTLLSA